jgi:hypothetical protein
MGGRETMLGLLPATLSTIEAAGIPEPGLVNMVMGLEAVDPPIVRILQILAHAWFPERFQKNNSFSTQSITLPQNILRIVPRNFSAHATSEIVH